MSTERVFDLLEMGCVPKGCLLPEDTHLLLAMLYVPKLETAGMKVAEWTRGALMLEEPYLSQVRAIFCRGCARVECQFNLHREPTDELRDLMNGQYADRIKKGEDLLAQLLPETKKSELEQKGIESIAFQMPSRKNPQLAFSFTRGDKTRRVSCEVGKRRIRTNDGEETLVSLEQLSQKIDEAIRAFA